MRCVTLVITVLFVGVWFKVGMLGIQLDGLLHAILGRSQYAAGDLRAGSISNSCVGTYQMSSDLVVLEETQEHLKRLTPFETPASLVSGQ